jgi:hypothetical protein
MLLRLGTLHEKLQSLLKDKLRRLGLKSLLPSYRPPSRLIEIEPGVRSSFLKQKEQEFQLTRPRITSLFGDRSLEAGCIRHSALSILGWK